jgi:hypothetical protein
MRKCRVQIVYAIAAVPIGKPGCPEFACWTASADKKRIVLIDLESKLFEIAMVPLLVHIKMNSL